MSIVEPNDEADGADANLADILSKVDSPSGTVLKHTEIGTNWVAPSEFVRVCKSLLTQFSERPIFGILGNWRCKYVDIRVDMRSGHFILLDSNGIRIDGEDEVLKKLGISPSLPPNL